MAGLVMGHLSPPHPSPLSRGIRSTTWEAPAGCYAWGPVAISSQFTDETMKAKDVCGWLVLQGVGRTAPQTLVSPLPSSSLSWH